MALDTSAWLRNEANGRIVRRSRDARYTHVGISLNFSAMQDIIVEKPYRFVPPHRGNWIPNLLQATRAHDKYLNYFEGVKSHEVRNADRLKESLAANNGIILAPNHCRYADPIALGWVAREASVHVYAMASWHLFQNRFQSLAMRLCGAFSVYREGIDRTSLNTAIDILTTGERPLVIFPEGTVFRTNDRIHSLLDGVAFLARSAAKRREKAGQNGVVIHPVAIKYLFRGDLQATVEPVLQALEKRLTWDEPSSRLSLVQRAQRLSEGLLALREIQYLGAAQSGSLCDRKSRLIDRLLTPLEKEQLGRQQDLDLLPRIKQLRTRLVPQLGDPATTPDGKKQIWQQLSDIYVAQIIEAYPEDYLDDPTDTRLLETVERLDEDVNDKSKIHRPWHAILDVGPAIPASSAKPPKNGPDPIMSQLDDQLKSMLKSLSSEARPLA